MEKVKACVTLGVDINTTENTENRDGDIIARKVGLTIAARNDDLELLEYFLSFPGLDKTYIACSLLMACGEGNDRIVRRLSTMGGFTNSDFGMSLGCALIKNNSECAKILLDTPDIDLAVTYEEKDGSLCCCWRY